MDPRLPAVKLPSPFAIEHPTGLIRFTPAEPEGQSCVGQVAASPPLSPWYSDRCPICLAPHPRSREHVPPKFMDGQALTRTCTKCNNDLGALTEATLSDWYSTSVSNVRLHHRDRAMRLGTAQVWRSENGPSLVFKGPFGEGIAASLCDDEPKSISYTIPSARIVGAALLKSAYLATCVALRAIPDGRTADEIRRILVETRDSRTILGALHPSSFRRLYRIDPHPGIRLAYLEIPSTGTGRWGFLFGGNVHTDWLLDSDPLKDAIANCFGIGHQTPQ